MGTSDKADFTRGPEICIYIEKLSRRTFVLDVTKYNTVKMAKRKLALEDPWYAAEDQYVIFEGRELKDGLKLRDYKIQNK
jgi:hypothetical protein